MNLRKRLRGTPMRVTREADLVNAQLDADSMRRPIGFGQKIVAAKAELNRAIAPPRMHPILIGLAVGCLVFTVAVVIERLLHDISEQAFKDMIRGNLKRLAKAAAANVDPKLHLTFKDPKQEQTAAYARAILPLERFQNADSEIAYVYTCIRKDGQVYFVLDPTPPGEFTEDGVESKSHIMDAYPEATRELLSTFDLELATADIKPYTDRWGSFISGYAPIKDEHGKTVGVAGIDLSSADYMNRLSSIHGAFWNGVLVAALLALLSGLAAGSMQAKSGAIHREAQERDRQYRNQIALTFERVESALKIAEVSRKRFSSLFEGIPVSCLTFDVHGKVFEFNTQALQTFNCRPEDIFERDLLEVMGRGLLGGAEEQLVRQVLEGNAFTNELWSDGHRYFLISGHPLQGPDGEITGGILASVDITRQKEAEDRVQTQLEALNQAHAELNETNRLLQTANDRLEELATTDMLTGLPNRRAFYEAMKVALSEAERGRGFVLVQADIDYFKMFNDVYGHHAGDEVLVLFGQAIRTSLRSKDFVARHGGEEFYIILSDTTRSEAEIVVERLRLAVAQIESGYGKVTASFGAAVWNLSVSSDEQLMQLSDDALYSAKAKGRNCLVFSDDVSRPRV